MHVITRMILGGAQENTLLTVEGLSRMSEYAVRLVTGPALGPEGELLERALRNGVDVDVIDSLRRDVHPWRDAESLLGLISRITRWRPDIVHTHSAKAGILGRLAARLCRVPLIVHTVHGLPFYEYQSAVERQAYTFAERVAGRWWTDRFITVCDTMKFKSVAAGMGREDRFETVYSGMEVDSFINCAADREAVRTRLGFGSGDFVMAKVARLAVLKGHEYLFEAFRTIAGRHPNARLLLIGDGMLKESLLKLARTMDIESKVVFAGLVEPSLIPELLRACDAVVHVSLREGLARVLPQSLLSGIPAVSFDIDGASEVVISGRTGYLVTPGSVDGLVEAIEKLIADPEEARRMGACGREMFARIFDYREMVARIDGLYRRGLNDLRMRQGGGRAYFC
jgi:glycosyltransferase involved in cell wall biosynthesis